MWFKMEKGKKIEEIFRFLIKNTSTEFKIQDLKFHVSMNRDNTELLTYTFDVFTTHLYDGIEWRDLNDVLKQQFLFLDDFFSENLINKNFKIINKKESPNTFVGVLLNTLKASNVEGEVDCFWEIYVEIYD